MNRGVGEFQSPEDQLAEYGQRLLSAVCASVEPWMVSAIRSRVVPTEWTEEMQIGAVAAAAACRARVESDLGELLVLDIERQSDTPLAILRRASVGANGVLARAGVEPVQRDSTEASMHPDDVYGLAPATWAELGPEVSQAAIAWGAAKAYVHLQRRR